ncbi:YndJ family protein [Paenibacillus thermotolerans]|uniref:YndJ family protein n=1 Tax=Paenibacillus thermotolerans TaxID=3027807 RepID=UPI002368832A|nr:MULTISPECIES: YndJ family protein [unclassified Paenibacillus]
MPNRLIQTVHSYATIGMLLWLCFWFIPDYDQTERIILFAVFVVVPLTLFRIFESAAEKPAAFLKLFVYAIPAGAAALAASFLLSPGAVSGLLSVPWGIATVLIALSGAGMLAKSTSGLASVSKAIGFMYIVVGGIWLVAHQFGVPLLGFKGHIMLLTVNHFHYAGFAAPVLFGFLHEYVNKRFLSGAVVILGGTAPILIALGMTYSPVIEWLSVVVFAFSLILYSILVFSYVVPKATGWTRGFHIVSSGVIWVTMALAVAYGYGQWTGSPTVPISTMIWFHGWGNAVLFSFTGMLAWHATLMDEAAGGIPFSRIQGKGRIGADVFTNLAVLDPAPKRRPTGLIDDMTVYRSEHFHPERLDQDIIDFYERTDDYELRLTPYWSQWFKLPAKVYKCVSNRLEQMNFPLEAETNDLQVRSVILPIVSERDGRSDVRAWVRTYEQSQKAIYAALYSTHVSGGTHYMNIAFPLPFSQMTSILRLLHGPDDTLALTSWPTEPSAGDQGVYLVFRRKAIRLPINETITVRKHPGSSEGCIEAKHDMWLFGMKFLTLDYLIYRKMNKKYDNHS